MTNQFRLLASWVRWLEVANSLLSGTCKSKVLSSLLLLSSSINLLLQFLAVYGQLPISLLYLLISDIAISKYSQSGTGRVPQYCRLGSQLGSHNGPLFLQFGQFNGFTHNQLDLPCFCSLFICCMISSDSHSAYLPQFYSYVIY